MPLNLDDLGFPSDESQPEQKPGPDVPVEIRIFAPNGDQHECLGSIGFRPSLRRPHFMDLLLVGANGLPLRMLNRQVVVVDKNDGTVLYDPTLSHLLGFPILDRHDVAWMKENPHWPKVLELHDNPVLPPEKQDGLFLGYEGEEA